MITRFEQGYALIIGISHYKQVSKLSETILKDALKLHDVIRDPSLCAYRDKHVKLLINEDATADGIRKELDWLVQSAGPDATAFIYFSGHGIKIPSTEQERCYLLPYESEPSDLPNTAIDSEEITTLLDKIPAQRLLFCLDCCYAGGIGEIKGPGLTFQQEVQSLDESDYENLARGTGRVILASSLENETSIAKRSMNNSMFTFYLLEALQGKAHIRNDGLIHVLDIFHHISVNMSSQNQHAIFKASTQDNFPIALYDRGKQTNNSSLPGQQKGTNVDERKLRGAMGQAFNRSELKLLCADIEQDLADNNISLTVNLETIGGDDGLPNQILSLIQYLKRYGHFDFIVRAVRRVRPGLI